MGSKNQTTTTTQNNTPWSAAQPALKTGLKDAEALYKAGVGFQPYTGSTVVPFANQTMSGMNAIEGAAGASAPAFAQNFANTASAVNQGGLNALQNEALGHLRPMAAGDMLTKNNPFTDSVVDRAAERMGTAIALQAGGMGRTGSGAHQGVLAREIGDMASNAYMQDYNRERGFQQDAIGSIFNAGQQQFRNQLDGSRGLTDAYNAMLNPAMSMMDVGGQYEDLQTRLANDQLRIFNETQRSPWAAIEQLNAIASGAGTLGGSTTGTQTIPGPSRIQSGLGGALAGGTMFGLPGALLGGLGGALF